MKLKVLKYYDRTAGFDSWVIDFIYRNESIRAIILDEEGKISDTDINDIEVEVK